jgi:hypothetical protein
MATDCSGLGAPELAMKCLLRSAVHGVNAVDVIWACDNEPSCQKPRQLREPEH